MSYWLIRVHRPLLCISSWYSTLQFSLCLSFTAVQRLQTDAILSLNPYYFKEKNLTFYEIMALSRFFYSTLAFSLNNCTVFSFLWLVEAKIEILKARIQEKEGVLSLEKKNMHKPNFALQFLFASANGTLLRNNTVYKSLYNASAWGKDVPAR